MSLAVHTVLQDVQQRLVYRINGTATSALASFVPGVADVDYPNVLQRRYAAVLCIGRKNASSVRQPMLGKR